ncbi:MAG: hypothetical protein IPK76_19890 [Lewinellaceae bacterium]|nr:hypothetical protein [Lewinellaceae bacterium]
MENWETPRKTGAHEIRIVAGIFRACRGIYPKTCICPDIPSAFARNGVADQETIRAVVQLNTTFGYRIAKSHIIIPDIVSCNSIGRDPEIRTVGLDYIGCDIPDRIGHNVRVFIHGYPDTFNGSKGASSSTWM